MIKQPKNAITRRESITRSGRGILAAGAAGLVPLVRTAPARAAEIQFRTLGRTGLSVSAVGFGGSRTNEPNVIKHALDTGINFIDTGRMYSGGRNEEAIGRVLREMKSEIVVQSKIDQNSQRDTVAMMKSIESSLTALGRDTVDIMLARGAATEDSVRNPVLHDAFGKAKEEGKIRFCGFSCHSANAAEMLKIGADMGCYDVIMVPYNHSGGFTHSIYGTHTEWDEVTLRTALVYAAEKGVGIAVMKTCSGGPYKLPGEALGTYREGLRWILGNKHVGVMAVAMASFREIEEDVGAMA